VRNRLRCLKCPGKAQASFAPVLCTCSLAIFLQNVMFILADDLGYNELNFMNNTRGILTPNLDKLANSGVVMKNYYVQPICSPTRSGKSPPTRF
jgi:hypothetical protein